MTNLEKWLMDGRTGLSSKFMVRVFNGMEWRRVDVPWDRSDFALCVGLLNAVPEYRPRLAELSAVSPKWERLVKIWDQLEKAPPGIVDSMLMQWDRADRLAMAEAVGDDKTVERLEAWSD
jgi:hypothetical protein